MLQIVILKDMGASPISHHLHFIKFFDIIYIENVRKIYPISLMERASGYEPQDTGSTPVWDN